MKKSQSLKGRKFNIITPKSSNAIHERNENNKNISKIVIKTIAEFPDLHLPIKKIPHGHITNKRLRQKNPKMNQISLEKLQMIMLNLKQTKNDSNKITKKKSKHKQFLNSSPNNKNNFLKNNYKIINGKAKKSRISKKILHDDIKEICSNYNSEDNIKRDNNVSVNNVNINDINLNLNNINRSNSIETDVNINLNNQSSDGVQFRNKDKKWYNNIEFLNEKYNEFILTTENIEKNLISKYLNGTDNIISEIEEPQFLKEDINININTINVNGSLRKHLSLRETTLDSSYHNSCTDKKIGRAKGHISNIKNFRKLFRKYRTNFAIKSFKNMNKYSKDNKKLKIRRRNEHKRKKKLPKFNKSVSKVNKQNNDEEKIVNKTSNYNNNNNNNNNLEYINYNKNTSYDIEFKDSLFSINEIKKRKNNNSLHCRNGKDKERDKDKFELEERNPSLDIIKETNDNININHNSCHKKEDKKFTYNNCRKQSAKIAYDSSKSRRKNKKRENSSKTKEKNTNITCSEKVLNNIRPKNSILKNKKLFNFKNTKSIHFFDEYLNIYKNINNTSIDDYEISTDLGVGSYAAVKLGVHKITHKKYAIKIYEKNVLKDEEKKSTIKNEIYILKQLKNENDNIMKLYDVIYTNKYLYLILEYIDGISLLDYIQNTKNRRINENMCKKIFYQIVKAISYCQNKNICHRDIKLENILILNNNVIKLIDFGFAVKCQRNEYQEFFCGTLYYMPPEIVNKQKYIPFYSDIWSLGVLLYTMLFGNFPFKANTEEKLFELINEAKVVFPDYVDVSDEVKKLLLKIIVIEPKKRISLEDILNDPWFEI